MADSPARTPRPLTADEVATLKNEAWRSETSHVLRLIATVEDLTARLAHTTSERDAADACVRRLDEQWEPYIDGQLWTQLMYGADNRVQATDEPMSDAEADAFCRATQARAAQPQDDT